MDHNAGIIMETLKRQAFERAKGELMSMLQTYCGQPEAYEEMARVVDEALLKMEDLL